MSLECLRYRLSLISRTYTTDEKEITSTESILSNISIVTKESYLILNVYSALYSYEARRTYALLYIYFRLPYYRIVLTLMSLTNRLDATHPSIKYPYIISLRRGPRPCWNPNHFTSICQVTTVCIVVILSLWMWDHNVVEDRGVTEDTQQLQTNR